MRNGWTRNNLTLQIRDDDKEVQIDPSNVFEKHSMQLFVQGKQEEGNYACIDSETGKLCRLLGADTLVAGTSFYKSTDRKSFVSNLCATN